MPDFEFPEYALKYSKAAMDTRRALPAELRPTLDTIEGELAEDPHKYPDRIIPASLDGTSFVYMHPNPGIQVTFQIDNAKKVLYFFHYSAPTFSPQQTVFVSYSHIDKPWMTKLRSFLTVLEQHGLIRFWDDSQLEAGRPWEEQIEEVLKSATAGLLLVSQEFLASDFVREKELPKLLDGAQKQGKRIFWLHLSPSTVFQTHEAITKYQSLLENPETSLQELDEPLQRKALVEMSKRLAAAVGVN